MLAEQFIYVGPEITCSASIVLLGLLTLLCLFMVFAIPTVDSDSLWPGVITGAAFIVGACALKCVLDYCGIRFN